LELPSIDFRSPKRKQGLKENTELIMQAIAALLPLEYRGLYA
jgi:hypothetical protein